MNRLQTLIFAVALALTTTACPSTEPATEDAQTPTAETPTAETSAVETPDDSPAATETPAATDEAEVAYEPAYPTEVSEDGLSEDDVVQQEASHDHDDGGHDHGEGADHDHEGGQGAGGGLDGHEP